MNISFLNIPKNYFRKIVRNIIRTDLCPVIVSSARLDHFVSCEMKQRKIENFKIFFFYS